MLPGNVDFAREIKEMAVSVQLKIRKIIIFILNYIQLIIDYQKGYWDYK
jgi:glyoxylate carboligase